MEKIDINQYEKEVTCTYKNENYSVRDNGAIFRHKRIESRLRPLDEKWTFGKPNNRTGYMEIASVRVHRIAATAFHGVPKTKDLVVDHIDTNRRNNRPENLRWLTKLENTLNNPITRSKIEFLCGSIVAFLKNPSILRNYVNENPNFNWMRIVTPEEAQISWQRLSNWATNGNNNNPSKGGSIGEWIFKENRDFSPAQEVSELVVSQTPNAVQKNWKTPSAFPCCPQEGTDKPIYSYTSNLKIGEVFSRNKYLYHTIVDYATSEDGNTLWVMCKNNEDDPIKPWSLAQVNYEDNLFIHTNLGSFFEKAGAEKQFTLVQGLEWTGGDSFDDYS